MFLYEAFLGFSNSKQWDIPSQRLLQKMRQVLQDKETIITKTPCGCIRAHSREAYKQAYGRDPVDDGIEPCSFELPHGGTMQAFKVPDVQSVYTTLGGNWEHAQYITSSRLESREVT